MIRFFQAPLPASLTVNGLLARRSRGFSLIEILVASLIFSVTTLGLMTTMAKNTQSIVSSDQAILATMLAMDITNRMQANPVGVREKRYTLSPQENTDCYRGVGCNPEAMARMDLFEWRQLVEQLFPTGEAVLCLDETPFDGDPDAPACSQSGEAYAVKIWWQENDAPDYLRSVFMFEVDL